ncbi:MAG TPA: FlgD immunoglobulin-like domain containing protein [Candidatus Krumholzibacteria bacterium]|nr:FlgD immunoglobulin-like domain containing protein [Candidatus Krumholzibacteria bacterium]HPD72109.1 FlgD immunoglobulin-like domain containing protein [Candidatus Krumholzibacteria bacterium]HRY40959.1 FlgD immunoglobulin-like domain containing protein [Candidatus Krumholzibacteria bacterium]
MRRIAPCLLALAILAGMTGTALADVSPSIEVRLVSPFVAVQAGETYAGRFEISCGEAGTLSGFSLASAGWSASLRPTATSVAVAAGDRVTLEFTAQALDPGQRLEFACDFNGYRVLHAIDLSERNVRNLTEGAATRPLPAFLDTPGDRTYGELDVLLGGELPPEPRGARRTVTVTGRFGCTRSDGAFHPAHSILIEVMDQDPIGDDVLATTSTNYDGYYTVTFNSDDAGWLDEPDVYVRFTLENGRVRVYEPSSGDNYVFATGVTNDYTGTYLDYGTLLPADPDLQACVFLHTQASRSWVHDNNMGYDVPACRVEWPSAAWPNCSGDGRIQMRSDFSWNDGCLWHEYGHWFDHELASWEPWNYCNGICDNSPSDCGHCFWCEESQAVAWLEGWAQFHSYAVGAWYPGYYGTSPLDAVSAENLNDCGGAYDDPLLTEGFIAALTQDIADNLQDSHGVYGDYTDRLATGALAVFTVNDLDNPTGSLDFTTKYLARNPGQREAFWETAANCGFMLDTTPPGVVTNLNSTDHTAGVASPDPTVRMVWTRASDNLSGIAGYGLYIASGGPGMPSAVQDIGDVTTYTTAALSPGTYYFCIRAVDNAGYWSADYASWGPIVIREPDPADLLPYLHAGWDYPLVPRSTDDATLNSAVVPPTLPGDATGTYWNIFGHNQGEASTGVGFYAWLNIDGVYTGNAYWTAVGAGGYYYGPNRGPVFVQPGRHSFTCRHDATDLVAETIESNNPFGRQFIWTPSTIVPGAIALRPAPPEEMGGWDEVTSGVSYYNCDGLRMATSNGWWHALAVWAESDDDDFDCRIHTASTGAQDGFSSYLAFSSQGYGSLDAVIANRNVAGDANWDVGVLRWNGDGAYRAYHAYSQTMAFGDSITVAMDVNQPILLREFYVSESHYGPVSVTASCDPTEGPLRLLVLHRDFAQGTLTSGSQVGAAWTGSDGFARVSADLTVAGWYGIAVYRDQSSGLDALDVTIEVSTTPPDLLPWTPAGWHAGITPRPALDGTNVWCPAPDTLFSTPGATYLNIAATNAGPVPSSLPTNEFFDGNYLGYVSWGELPAGATVSYNWNHAFAFAPGRHVLSMRVDPAQEIEETNEGNNVRGEQWIWSPVAITPPQALVRSAPPVSNAGWSDITTGEGLWYNCDGLRLVGTGSGYWKAVAILPAAGSDFDLRLHARGVGAKTGFATSLVGSFEGGTKTEYVLVDYNVVSWRDFDVGILRWSGAGTYQVHAGASIYHGSHPTGYWGPFSVPAGGLVEMHEFLFAPETYTVTVENLSDADLGVAVHRSGQAYQNRAGAVAFAAGGGAGEGESLSFAVDAPAYYCLIVYRDDQAGDPAPFRLHIANSLTPVVEDGLPRATRLAGAWPNPFNPQTTIAFELARADHARVAVFDLQGRVVRTLVDEDLPAGRHTAVWQGCDDGGRAVASGVYFVRLQAESGGGMAKVVLVK